MKRRTSLYALSVLALALACENAQQPTGPKSVTSTSKIISDGAHGGNRDFFFLPPLVPLPTAANGFEAGEFNAAIRPSLSVEICRLKPDKLDNLQLPTPETPCFENGPFFTFAPGSVQLVTNPGAATGWWTGKNLPSDGFYYVQWDTRAAHLNAEKFYRVKVFLAGSTVPLGVVDIDPMKKESEFLQSRVGEVVQITDGILLPIAFRVENAALCGGATLCSSETVTNTGGTVTVDGGGGAAIAGASFPPGWLPVGPGRPTSVVVTIAEFPSSAAEDGTRTIPCHAGLPFQQFNKCFRFTTIPELTEISPGVQFAQDVTVAVCYTLIGGNDRRRDYAELFASDVGEPPHALEEVADAGILSADARDCEPDIIGFEPQGSDPLTRLASTGWRGLKNLFGVKTAYAVDGGLGGIVKGFSFIGPAIKAEIEPYPHPDPEPAITDLPIEEGTAFAQVRVVGSHSHAPGPSHGARDGINDVPVTFQVVGAGGTIQAVDLGDVPQLTVMTHNQDGEGPSGVASVVWNPPTVPGVYTLTATGPTQNTVTFRVTVPDTPLPPEFVVTSGTPSLNPTQITTAGGIVTLSAITVRNTGASFSFGGGSVRFGVYLSTDANIDPEDQLVGSASLPSGELETTGDTFTVPFPVGNIPAGVAAGNYFLGFLIDDNDAIIESNEGNNFVSAPLVIIAPPSNSIQLGLTERRMVSMQTNADLYPTVAPPLTIADLTTNGNDGVGRNAGVVFIRGGPDGEGVLDAGTTITSVLSNGQPGPTLLVNSFAFDTNPRTTTLVWKPVSGATSYEIDLQYGNMLTGASCLPADCEVWTAAPSMPGFHHVTTDLTYTLNLTIANAIRWRVTARNASGGLISQSQYIHFKYQEG